MTDSPVVTQLIEARDFWIAIIGTVVGGVISAGVSLLVHVLERSAARRERAEDSTAVQRALGTSLLLKTMRIHSNLEILRRHLTELQENAAERDANDEPYVFLIPLASLPKDVIYTPDELGMLLHMRDDQVFNSVLSMDDSHNMIIAACGTMFSRRMALTDRLKAHKIDDMTKAVEGTLGREEWLAVRPMMIEVNVLFDQLFIETRARAKDSGLALDSLHALLRRKPGFDFQLLPNPDLPSQEPTPAVSEAR